MTNLPKKLSEITPSDKEKGRTKSRNKKQEKAYTRTNKKTKETTQEPIQKFPKKIKSSQDTSKIPVITKITTQKQQGRYNIFIDDHFAFGVDESILAEYLLHKGMEMPQDLQEKLKGEDDVQKGYHRALDYLNYGLRTRKEVTDNLIEKDYGHVADQVLSMLEDRGYVDDLNYAESYVRTKAKINAKGPRVIEQELFQKGVKQAEIERAMTEYPRTQQFENAKALGEKQIKKSKKRSSRETQNKINEFLMRKGFDREIIQEVLATLDYEKSDEEEWLAIEKQGEKAWRRYRRFELYEQSLKTKSSLYRKGFPKELIDQFIEKKEEEKFSD